MQVYMDIVCNKLFYVVTTEKVIGNEVYNFYFQISQYLYFKLS